MLLAVGWVTTTGVVIHAYTTYVFHPLECL